MSKVPWHKILTADTDLELQEVGRMLSQAREQRNMSLTEMANRIGVDRRTLTELEKGNPKVSLGVFFQALSVLNLLRGIEEIVRPENDIEAISSSIRRIRGRKPKKKVINEEDVNF